MPRTITATRFIPPQRAGGACPAIIEADDDRLYVPKLRGAGQGPKVLIAELICGELGHALGLGLPEIVFVEFDPALGHNTADSETQAHIKASAGLNLASAYLPGAVPISSYILPAISSAMASAIVWFDAYITNVDRTLRNPNLLLWHHRLWLIDHGAALYVHYTWTDYLIRARSAFRAIRNHILLPRASEIYAADAILAPRITPALIERIVANIPDAWLGNEPAFTDATAHRAAYATYLLRRLESPRTFVAEALQAHTQRP